jgi:FMN phosphatase YigB (HAD superfamily)
MALELWPENEMRRTEFQNIRRQVATRNTLYDIYADDGMAKFPEYSSDELMETEMATESELLTVNPIIRDKIESLRCAGWTIKFLSDMYLPSNFLTNVLKREGCLIDDEEVIVSCEWHARKDTGTLYKKVKDKYAPSKWIHFGDNRHSDYRMAHRNGVEATLVDCGFTGVEQKLISEGDQMRDGWRLALITGITRTARIKAEFEPTASMAADYVAALYVPYVVWLLRQAKHMGITRLHFLSRDGYTMMKIAEVIAPKDIQLNYLFVSRKALMRAYLAEDSVTRFVEIADRKSLIGRTVNYFLGQLQLSRNELKERYGIEFAYNRIANYHQQEDFLNKIFNNGRFSSDLASQFAADASLTIRYLRQEGLTDGIFQAMVDIGWLGTSRMMVNKILKAEIPTFYVGVRGDVYDRSCGDFGSYFDAGQLDTTATGLIENYYSASPWPSTIGYELNDNEVVPKFANAHCFENTAITKTNVEICQHISKELSSYFKCLDDDILFKWARISIDSIVNITGNIDLTPLTNGKDFDGVPMARKLNIFELLNFTLTGARYTAFDRASLRLTVGSHINNVLWRLHMKTSTLRSRIYALSLKI